MAREKEFSDYSQRNDHANGDELMVEITLAEYRQLVHDHAVSEHEKNRLNMKLFETEKKLKDVENKLIAAMLEQTETDEEAQP